MIERLAALIKAHEGTVTQGKRHVVYDDATGRPYRWATQGQPTIGHGRLLTRGLSEDEAEYLFMNDVREVFNLAKSSYAWFDNLDDARKAVVLSMLFNIGPTRFAGFRKMIAALERGDYSKAADEMKDSLWATQVRRRARDLADMMRSGVWQRKA